MNFKKLIPYAKAEMQKMTDDEFMDAGAILLTELKNEVKRRNIPEKTFGPKIVEALKDV